VEKGGNLEEPKKKGEIMIQRQKHPLDECIRVGEDARKENCAACARTLLHTPRNVHKKDYDSRLARTVDRWDTRNVEKGVRTIRNDSDC